MGCREFDGDCHTSDVGHWFAMTGKSTPRHPPRNDTERRRAETTTPIYRTTWPPALRANSQFAALPREAPDDTLCFLPSYTYCPGNAREISRSQIGAEVLTIYSRQSREIRYNRSYQTNQNSGPVPEEKKGRILQWLFLF